MWVGGITSHEWLTDTSEVLGGGGGEEKMKDFSEENEKYNNFVNVNSDWPGYPALLSI